MLDTDIKLCRVSFSGFDTEYPTLEIGVYSIGDLLQFLRQSNTEFEQEVLAKLNTHKFAIQVNEEFMIEDVNNIKVLLPYQENKVKIFCLPLGQGGDLGKIGVGVGLLALGLSGVGLLGISATGVSLFGASLVFSSLFKHPKTDTKESKRSANFSGTINSTGSTVLPLVFGEYTIGSIVASAQIVPHSTTV